MMKYVKSAPPTAPTKSAATLYAITAQQPTKQLPTSGSSDTVFP
jgi:hypothetical protein